MKRENKQKDKVLVTVGILFLIVLISISSVYALNAKIGNGKVVLYSKVGDIVEKSVKVINDNNITINIELIPDGDLKDQIKFKKANFTLEPHQEIDSSYSLKVTKEGKTTSYINVKFTPVGEKNGIILPASIIIFAEKNNGTASNNNNNGLFDFLNNNKTTTINNSTTSGDDNQNKLSPVAIGLVLTAIIFVILLILLYIYSKNKEKQNKEEKINQKKKAK